MRPKEKGRQKGDPIPNFVLADMSESKRNITRFQAESIAQRFVHGVAVRTIIHAVTGGPLATALELAVLD
jgi:hypothetical protein